LALSSVFSLSALFALTRAAIAMMGVAMMTSTMRIKMSSMTGVLACNYIIISMLGCTENPTLPEYMSAEDLLNRILCTIHRYK